MVFRAENQCPCAGFDDKNILTACFRLHSLEAKLRQSRELGIVAYSCFMLSFVDIIRAYSRKRNHYGFRTEYYITSDLQTTSRKGTVHSNR
ncbi:hypothetical protein NC652_023897 [Populus alba x Populus x berolinensis]|nr:hypothetical protein NC652_023897 [Populus alba x Populus x berolinensis]